MVDRLVVQTQDTIRALAQESTDNNNDINYATGVVQDADNSKQVNTFLQFISENIKPSGMCLVQNWAYFNVHKCT
jgi:ABC-type molybdate transport system substrate-binding protein